MPYRYLRLRQRCLPLLNQIDFPRPFSAHALCRTIASQRGRQIHLHPLPPEASSTGACGVLLATATADHIFYESQTSHVHQEHIVLHELGHLLFNHHRVDARYTAVMGDLLPDLSDSLVTRLLGRTNYTTRQEQEAETLASLIRTSADRANRYQPRSVTGKLGAALGIETSEDE
ncbi:ImmA/IrrE family metallo-endopeptidase [Streptomyces sp. Rer75]|uniref:ImmA/IrrE family metallo-endopeptidase n=1 Tax=Streptomyces sp. Rer75 TaxID=2750011 RepID=UPI0015D05FE3|nr:ImmA/IrrE family metallo-endopeptidase [Streptomyces sp. Rer75]QLH19369.1 ImmA/IrrE family metallo-endopeptidase [Streptomyces sp. Rer75]QLH26692.1 ImmA/IrrE family metallo-endopeptidase [Streptomyces sp. Rer75]